MKKPEFDVVVSDAEDEGETLTKVADALESVARRIRSGDRVVGLWGGIHEDLSDIESGISLEQAKTYCNGWGIFVPIVQPPEPPAVDNGRFEGGAAPPSGAWPPGAWGLPRSLDDDDALDVALSVPQRILASVSAENLRDFLVDAAANSPKGAELLSDALLAAFRSLESFNRWSAGRWSAGG